MGVTERKERERLEKKKAILETAMEMYMKEGFENLSIRAIANRMEYSVGTIYLYYKDRAELINALMEEGFKKLVRAYESIKFDGTPLTDLRKIMLKYMEFGFKNPEYYELMFLMTKPPRTPRRQEDYPSGMASYKALADIVDNCIKAKLISYDKPDVASLHIWGFMHGLVSLHIKRRLLPQDDPEPAFLSRSIDRFIRAIKA
jgi:AcrR family transcriptional regulator